jgi:hypothetical protein
MITQEGMKLLAKLLELRQKARQVYQKEIIAFDEDRVMGGDPAVHASAEDRVLRELRSEILDLLGVR